MTLANPQLGWMLVALLAATAVPLWRNRQMLSRRARVVAMTLRAAAIAFACLALMEPGQPTEQARTAEAGPQTSTVCLVDVSASVKPEELSRSLEAVKRMLAPGAARPEVLLFAGDTYRATAAELESLRSQPPADWLKSIAWRGPEREFRQSTHLERALRSALELPVRAAVLFSDGNETTGSAEKALPLLQARKLKLSVVPLEPLSPDTLTAAALELPQSVLEEREFEGCAVIRSATAGRVNLRLLRGDQALQDGPVEVRAGLTRVPFKDKLPTAGVFSYRVEVRPEAGLPDGRPEDDRLHGAVRAVRVPKVLVISRDASRLAKMLDSVHISHHDRAPGAIPADQEALAAYSAVIVDNIDVNDMPAARQELLASYVKDHGGGLLAIGGDHGFGAGGWSDTPIDKILPVNAAPKGFDRSMGLLVLLDASGSMAGFPILYARQAVKEIIGLMRGRWLGVIKFSHVTEIAVSFQVIGAESYVVRQDIEGIEAGGGTLFYQPLRDAIDLFSKVSLEQKHVLLLSDGEAADFFMVRSLFDQLQSAEIKVSTMAVGRYVNTANLEELADATGGRFYQGEDFSKLPEMFRQEVKRISGPPIVEMMFRPERTTVPGPFSAVIPPGELPLMHGYDATTSKPRAEVVLRSAQGDPILAAWRIGVGKSAAFTTDLSDWGRDWVTWPDAPRFLSSLLGELGRLEASDYHITASSTGGIGRVVVDAIDPAGQYLNFQKLGARLTVPGGGSSVLDLRQTGPGRYETTFEQREEGTYALRLHRSQDGKQVELGETATALQALPEYRCSGPNLALLERLARATGGERLAAEKAASLPSESLAPIGSNPVSTLPFWPLAAFLALLVFLSEITCRRLGKFSGSSEWSSQEGSTGESASAYQKIAENYLRLAREMDARGETARAAETYLKARSYFLKAQQTEKAKVMWDRYRLLEDRRTHGR